MLRLFRRVVSGVGVGVAMSLLGVLVLDGIALISR